MTPPGRFGRTGSFLLHAATVVVAAALLAAAPAGAQTAKEKKSAKAPSADTKKAAASDDKPKTEAKKPTAKRSAPAKKSAVAERKSSEPRPDPITTSTPQTLPGILDALLTRVSAASRWGVQVMSLRTGQVLYTRNAGQEFVPASNRKLFTGALALDQLGPDFQYRTYLYRTGKVDAAGTLKGNLVIRPQGDPTFSDRMLKTLAPGTKQEFPSDWIYRDWVDKVQAEQIKHVDGELVVDCSDWVLDNLQPKGWPARIKEDYYAPKTSPLTINENLMEFRVKPGKAGGPGIVEFVPPAEGYPVVNNTVTGGKGGVSISRDPSGKIVLSGAPTARSATETYAAPCDNPTLYAAAVFRSHLRERGITIAGSIRVVTQKRAVPPPTSENVVAVYLSPPISEVVKTMMRQSNNHFAEQIYVSVSAIRMGAGSYRNSKAIEMQFLRKSGLNDPAMNFEDGSGLSVMNKVAPDDVCRLLAAMQKHPASKAYFESMAVAGQRDGTLRNRMRGANLADRVHAKTGYINGVVCLSGYFTLQPDHLLAFSFLVNEVRTSVDQVKGAQDRLCEALSQLQM